MNLTLADKISGIIIVLGLFGLSLVFYSSYSYRNLAYQHHQQAIQALAQLEVDEHIKTLQENTTELALSIEHAQKFDYYIKQRNAQKLSNLLDNQFYQYFVTAGVLKLLKLYILDTQFTLLSQSREGIHTGDDATLLCPRLSQMAQQRRGSEKLQILARPCAHNNKPVYAVIVPFGGLTPDGYILIITDMAYALRNIEKALGIPIQIANQNQEVLYRSSSWPDTKDRDSFVTVNLPVHSDDSEIMTLSLHVNMTTFNRKLNQHRNWVLTLSSFGMIAAVMLALLIFRRSNAHPLSRILEVIEKIQTTQYSDSGESRLLFEQLLEQIIMLRHKNHQGFAVMILDLTQFKQVNIHYGELIGDKLLEQVEKRLCNILRESDKISWVGTDTPGHKLLPSDSKTFYRATLARLGGDEFGLLLPSAKNAEQVKTVAERIITELDRPYLIDDKEIAISCKIGISLFPDHGDDESTLIRKADKAMFSAKENSQAYFIYQSAEISD